MIQRDELDEKVSILIVDDQPGNLLSLKAVLERPDYDLVLAHDGKEALSLVLRQEFAAILLDVAMPNMDGFEVAAIIKQREAYRSIPIIFVTASVQHIEWIFKGYSVGAVDFLQKPLDPQQVRAKVAVFVELFRQKRQIQRQAAMLRERERLEQSLELDRLRMQHERRFRHLAEALPHVVWVASADGLFEYVSRRWSDTTGSPDSAALALGWIDHIHPDDAAQLRAAWTGSIRAGAPFDFEFRLRRADGTFRWHFGRALPEREAGSNEVRWLGTFTDVDEQKRAHEELRAAVRMRDEFLSIASHELRTPLTALQLRLESLSRGIHDGKPVERIEQGLSHAARQGDRLAELVGRLLDVSRLATGGIELHLEEFDVGDVARDVVNRMSDAASRAGCVVDLQVAGAQRGRWDRLRIDQVFTNLLSNAFKYGAGKPVQLAVTSLGDDVKISVADQGIGISPDAVDRIFGRFERAAPIRHYAGLGLGLYIVAQIVEAHRGRVHVETEPERGATFVIELPRQTTSEQWNGSSLSVAPKAG